MSFPVRVHTIIRSAILADWRARYLALSPDYDLDTSVDSESYNWADAVAFQLEGAEAYAAQLAREMFPDTASSAFLERHASVIGLTRKAATRAELSIAVTGTGNYTASDRLVDVTGASFAPKSSGSIAGSGFIVVRADTAGTAGNLAAGATLTWAPAPSGIDATATVASTMVVARDDELDSELAQRVLAWWRDRPGGGNNADWAAWVEERDEVAKAFVYPLRHPAEGDGTLGATLVCALGPVPTTTTDAGEPDASATRLLSVDTLDEIRDELVGAGVYAVAGGRAPASQHPDDVSVTTPSPLAVDVELELVLGATQAFPFAAPHPFTASTTTSVTTTTLPSGVGAGMRVHVAVPDPAVRGEFAYRTAEVGGGPGAYTWTWDTPVSTAPAPADIRPLPSIAGTLRAAVLSIIDSLGPGLGTAPSARWPTADEGAFPATLYRGALVAAAMGIPGLPGAPAGVNGIVNAACTLPLSDVTPIAEQIVTLGALAFTKAP